MRDVLFTIPLPFGSKALPIHAYGVMAMLGFLAALVVARWRAKRLGVSADAITDICIGALMGGIVGSRVFYVLQNAGHYFDTSRPDFSILDLFKLWEGGLVFYGGFFGAVAVMVGVIHFRKERVLNVFDIMSPSLALAMTFGRIGCLLHGCCYGVPLRHNAWYGLVYPLGSQPYSGGGATSIDPGTPLFPSQPISSFDNFLIFILLSLFFTRRKREGEVVGMLFLLYSVHRFVIEFWRGDTHPPGVLSPAQWISIVLFFAALAVLTWCRTHPQKTLVNAMPETPSEPATAPGKRRRKKRGK